MTKAGSMVHTAGAARGLRAVATSLFVGALAAITLGGAVVPAQAADGFTYTTTDNKVTITGYTGTVPTDLVIPATLGGNPVTVIAREIFYNKSLTSLSLPDSLTEIGLWAFGNNSLTSLTIPALVTAIGDQAFNWNAGLTSVTFLGNAPSAGYNVFFQSPVPAVDVPAGSTGWAATWSDIPVRFAVAPVTKPVYVSGAKFAGLRDSVNSKLTAVSGTWTSATATSKKYAWYVCTKNVASLSMTGRVAAGCKAISNATKSTYVISAEMKKKFIAVKITVTNGSGSASIFTKSTRSLGTW